MPWPRLGARPTPHARHEARLDGRHRGGRPTLLAAQKVQAVLPVENRVRGLAHVAQHVLGHVAPQNPLEHLGQEPALDNQPLLAIQRPRRTQLGQQEGLDVVRLPVHGLAELHEVDEDRLLRPLAEHLRWLHDGAALLPRKLGVVLPQDAKHPVEELVVCVVPVRPLPGEPRPLAGRGSRVVFLLGALVEAIHVHGLLLLLLLLHHGEVEGPEIVRARVITRRGVPRGSGSGLPHVLQVALLLLLLLFLGAREHGVRVVAHAHLVHLRLHIGTGLQRGG
mmetsp:Transcript_29278/g.93678  ORF Transcript_29278/g.93678 Transcript_29278/m.93678 type:complete len:279 (-) Transcript_29278:133-969(-)